MINKLFIGAALALAITLSAIGQTTNYWLVVPKQPSGYTKIKLGPISKPEPSLLGNGAIVEATNAPPDAVCLAALTPNPLATAQAAQIALLNKAYNAALASGITVTGGGITATLPADVNSQNTFTRFMVQALAAGTAPTASETIFDINGAPVTNTLANIQALLVAYGAAIKADQVDLLTKTAQVQAATTTAAVQAITYP